MKNCAFLLIIYLTLNINSALIKEKTRDIFSQPKLIPQRSLVGDEKLHDYLKNAYAIIDANKGDAVIETEDISGQEAPEKFTFKFTEKEGCEIEGIIDGAGPTKNIKITFTTPLDNSNLVLTNIDPQEEEQNMIKKYIEPYFKHVSEIFSGKEKVIEVIKGMENELGVSDPIKAEISENEGNIDVTLTNGNVKELYRITVEDVNGTLNVKIKNIFFETNFDLTIPTESFLKSQLVEMFQNVQVHYERIKKLSSNGDSDKAEKQINCEAIKTLLSSADNNTYKDQTFEMTDQNIKFGEHDFDYSCTENEENHFIIVKMSKDSINMVQSVLTSSLYDLEPALESFYDDVKETMYKSFIDKSDDNLVIYAGEGEKQDDEGNEN